MESVNNTHYQKLFNEDCKRGGKLYSLSTSAFRVIILLRANANTDGIVCNSLGKAYSDRGLSELMGIARQTARQAMYELDKAGLVKETEHGISIEDFTYDMTARGSGNGSVRREKHKQVLVTALKEATRATNEYKVVATEFNHLVEEYYNLPALKEDEASK